MIVITFGCNIDDPFDPMLQQLLDVLLRSDLGTKKQETG